MGDKLERDIAAQPAIAAYSNQDGGAPQPFSPPGKCKSIVREVFKRSLMCLLACLRCSPPSLDPGAAMLLSPQAEPAR
jgi:hypothetical protein